MICKPFDWWVVNFLRCSFIFLRNIQFHSPFNRTDHGCSNELCPSVSTSDPSFRFFFWVSFFIQNTSDCTKFQSQVFLPPASAFRRRRTQKKFLFEISFRQCLLGPFVGLSLSWWRIQGQLWAPCILEGQATGGSFIHWFHFADLFGLVVYLTFAPHSSVPIDWLKVGVKNTRIRLIITLVRMLAWISLLSLGYVWSEFPRAKNPF